MRLTPRVVPERLNHGDIAMTMNVDAHVTAGMQRDAVDRLDALVCGHVDDHASEGERTTSAQPAQTRWR
jgi:predicted RNase H-like nuclease